MRNDFPSPFQGSINHRSPFQGHFAVHCATCGNALRIKNIKQTPNPDTLTVFPPGVVSVIVYISGKVAANDAWSAWIIRLCRVSDRIPIFHVDGQDNSEAFAIGPFQWISVRDWNEVVMHNGVSLPEKPEVKRCSVPASGVKPIPRPWRCLGRHRCTWWRCRTFRPSALTHAPI